MTINNINNEDILWDEILDEDIFWDDDEPSLQNCYNCGGRGYLHGDTGWECPTCNGTGIVEDE